MLFKLIKFLVYGINSPHMRSVALANTIKLRKLLDDFIVNHYNIHYLFTYLKLETKVKLLPSLHTSFQIDMRNSVSRQERFTRKLLAFSLSLHF